ncbi:MAG: hypothetical protein QW228_08015 [Candidatus Aenigmatarchaeota archaeon]
MKGQQNIVVYPPDIYYNKTEIDHMINQLKSLIDVLNHSLQEHTHKVHVFVGCFKQIADDITGYTSIFYLNLTQLLNENRTIVAVSVRGVRVSGSGILYAYPNEAGYPLAIGTSSFESTIIIKYGTNRLALSMSVSTDVWDVYCYGYVVEEER